MSENQAKTQNAPQCVEELRLIGLLIEALGSSHDALMTLQPHADTNPQAAAEIAQLEAHANITLYAIGVQCETYSDTYANHVAGIGLNDAQIAQCEQAAKSLIDTVRGVARGEIDPEELMRSTQASLRGEG